MLSDLAPASGHRVGRLPAAVARVYRAYGTVSSQSAVSECHRQINGLDTNIYLPRHMQERQKWKWMAVEISSFIFHNIMRLLRGKLSGPSCNSATQSVRNIN